MTSDEKPPEQVPPNITVQAATYPDGHNFPQDLLAEWIAIPPEERIVIGPISRAGWDHFLFSAADIAAGIGQLRLGLIAYSHGQIQTADVFLQNALNRIIDGETRHRILFEEIMRSAIEVRKNAGK
jgi:hypothetical protein